jgi:hypothetical protein
VHVLAVYDANKYDPLEGNSVIGENVLMVTIDAAENDGVDVNVGVDVLEGVTAIANQRNE